MPNQDPAPVPAPIPVNNQIEFDAVTHFLSVWRQLELAGHYTNKIIHVHQAHREISVRAEVSFGSLGTVNQTVLLIRTNSAIARAIRRGREADAQADADAPADGP